MKPAFKYAMIAVLYEAGEQGLWEYELYDLLKTRYEKARLCSLREELIGFSTLGWTSMLAVREFNGTLLRKIRLQKRHHPFIEYQLNVKQLLLDLNITPEEIAKYQQQDAEKETDGEVEQHGQYV